jgi:hypothetical protein
MRRPVRRLGQWAAAAAVLILAACGEEPTSAPESAVSGAPPAADAAAGQATPEAGGQATVADQADTEMPAVEPSAGQRAAAAARVVLQGSGSEAVAGDEAAEEANAGIESATKEVAEVGQEVVGQAQAPSAGAARDAAQTAGGAATQRGTDRSGREGAGEAPATVAALSEGQSTASQSAADGVDAILARGRLVAVIENDFAPFSFDDGRRVGFDVDMSSRGAGSAMARP